MEPHVEFYISLAVLVVHIAVCVDACVSECECGFEWLSPRCGSSKCTWHKQEVQTTNIYPRIETPLTWQDCYGEYLYMCGFRVDGSDVY